MRRFAAVSVYNLLKINVRDLITYGLHDLLFYYLYTNCMSLCRMYINVG